MRKFRSKKPHYEYLRKKWTARHKAAEDNFWNAHGQSLKQLALPVLGGLMLLSSPSAHPTADNLIVSKDDALKNYDMNVLLAAELRNHLPTEVRPLTPEEEKAVTDILSKNFGFRVMAKLDDVRLNKNYGVIGGEQHLYRYPGDSLYAHFDNTREWAMYGDAGIAPSLGAWGYFSHSKQDFTDIIKLREKYYLAIQTFLVPGYAENVHLYRDFFKFRKMLVVNPQTGQAVIAVVGDAGPSAWTGKDLGGSPEVMHQLGLAEGPRKGAVVYFFIDDPNDEIPLGSIKIRNQT